MAEKVIIYGKGGWHYTADARSAYGDDAQYVDVKADKGNLEEMLKYSGGVREVPVILKGEEVTIGYGGTWGVWWITVCDFSYTHVLNFIALANNTCLGFDWIRVREKVE